MSIGVRHSGSHQSSQLATGKSREHRKHEHGTAAPETWLMCMHWDQATEKKGNDVDHLMLDLTTRPVVAPLLLDGRNTAAREMLVCLPLASLFQ